jgi:hypothetical protein
VHLLDATLFHQLAVVIGPVFRDITHFVSRNDQSCGRRRRLLVWEDLPGYDVPAEVIGERDDEVFVLRKT